MTERTDGSNLQPAVFVFPLSEVGTWLKKRVPAAYAGCAGYWYRAAHEEHFEALGAIEEPDMSEKEAKKILGWVEEYVDVCSLRESIYTDEQYEAIDEADDDSFGFHAGATFDEAVRALEAGGFRVVRAPFPQTLAYEVGALGAEHAVQLDAIIARIEHHFMFASIPSALRMLEDCDQVSLHLRQVMSLLDNFLGAEPEDRLMARLLEAHAGWPRAHVDKLHLALAEINKWALRRSQSVNANIPRLRAALPPVQDAKVGRALEKSDAPVPPAKAVARKAVKVTKG